MERIARITVHALCAAAAAFAAAVVGSRLEAAIFDDSSDAKSEE